MVVRVRFPLRVPKAGNLRGCPLCFFRARPNPGRTVVRSDPGWALSGETRTRHSSSRRCRETYTRNSSSLRRNPLPAQFAAVGRCAERTAAPREPSQSLRGLSVNLVEQPGQADPAAQQLHLKDRCSPVDVIIRNLRAFRRAVVDLRADCLRLEQPVARRARL